MRRDSNICKELLKDGQKVRPRQAAAIYWLGTLSEPDCIVARQRPSPRPPPRAWSAVAVACGSGSGIDAQLHAALWQLRLRVPRKAVPTRPSLQKAVLLDCCSATEAAEEQPADFLRLGAAYGMWKRSGASCRVCIIMS